MNQIKQLKTLQTLYLTSCLNKVAMGFNVMKKDWIYYVLKKSSVLAELCNITVSSEELIGTREYLTLWTRCRIYWRRYNWVELYISVPENRASTEDSNKICRETQEIRL
jgi:hypothetical protein